MLQGDRLDLMTLFVRIAETGRLAEASRMLGLSQPAASRMMKRLETVLGVELVRRSTRGLTLTHAGEQFAVSARSILAQWEKAAEQLEEGHTDLSGHIRVVAPVGLGQNVLAKIFAAFIKLNPGITIDCDLLDASIDLPSHGYDLQIRAGPVSQQSHVVRDLWQINRSIVASPDHPVVTSPRDLVNLPSVRLKTFVPPNITLTHIHGDCFDLRIRSAFSVDNLYAALNAVRGGIGYAVLPLFLTQRLIEKGELIPLCPEWRPPEIILSLIYEPRRTRSRRLSELLQFLRHELTMEAGMGSAFLDDEGARETVTIAPFPKGANKKTRG